VVVTIYKKTTKEGFEVGKSGSETSKISSNIPISEITFVRKDGMFFISQGQNKNGTIGFFKPKQHAHF
jgi:hypothetical protein